MVPLRIVRVVFDKHGCMVVLASDDNPKDMLWLPVVNPPTTEPGKRGFRELTNTAVKFDGETIWIDGFERPFAKVGEDDKLTLTGKEPATEART